MARTQSSLRLPPCINQRPIMLLTVPFAFPIVTVRSVDEIYRDALRSIENLETGALASKTPEIERTQAQRLTLRAVLPKRR